MWQWIQASPARFISAQITFSVQYYNAVFGFLRITDYIMKEKEKQTKQIINFVEFDIIVFIFTKTFSIRVEQRFRIVA